MNELRKVDGSKEQAEIYLDCIWHRGSSPMQHQSDGECDGCDNNQIDNRNKKAESNGIPIPQSSVQFESFHDCN